MQIQLRKKSIEIKKFGVEIECYNVDAARLKNELDARGIAIRNEGYNHTVRPHWKIVGDASIHGMNAAEVVSPILSGAEGLEQVAAVCSALKAVGAKVNKSCGLHIHHDAQDFNSDKLVKVVRVYQKMEKMIDSFMPRSRRADNGRYCRSVIGCDPVSVASHGHSRYHKINLQSWYRQGSIEFRHHSGTVEADKIINWIIFTALIVDKARGRVVSDKVFEKWVDVKWYLEITTDACDETAKELAKFYDARRRNFRRAA